MAEAKDAVKMTQIRLGEAQRQQLRHTPVFVRGGLSNLDVRRWLCRGIKLGEGHPGVGLLSVSRFFLLGRR